MENINTNIQKPKGSLTSLYAAIIGGLEGLILSFIGVPFSYVLASMIRVPEFYFLFLGLVYIGIPILVFHLVFIKRKENNKVEKFIFYFLMYIVVVVFMFVTNPIGCINC